LTGWLTQEQIFILVGNQLLKPFGFPFFKGRNLPRLDAFTLVAQQFKSKTGKSGVIKDTKPSKADLFPSKEILLHLAS